MSISLSVIGEQPISALPGSYAVYLTPAGLAADTALGTETVSGGATITQTGLWTDSALGVESVSGGSIVPVTGMFTDSALGVVTVLLVYQGFNDLVRRADGAGQYLVQISALQGGQVTAGGGLTVIGELPISALPPGGTADIGTVDLLYSDRFWVGSPTDVDKPNTEYENRVALPIAMTRTMPIQPEEPRRGQRQAGFLELINTDGALDNALQNYAIDGREISVFYGPYMEPFDQFQIIAQLLGVRWEGGRERLRAVVRDRSYTLDKPVQETFYLGTGGAEGGAELEGKPKPLVYGEVLNISITLIDATNLVYQVHDGAIDSVVNIYDRGLSLTLDTAVGTGGDVANYAALIAASPAAGNYITSVAEGLIRLASSPAGLVTADIKGDDTGSVYVDTIGGICQRVMSDRASLASAWINGATWDALPSYSVGIYISPNDATTSEQLIDFLTGSIGASWGPSRAGVIRAYQPVLPETQPTDLYLGEEDIIDMVPLSPPNPRWRQAVGYEKNWTIQRGEDLAGSVTDARRQFLKDEYRFESSTDLQIRTRHAESLNPPLLAGGLVASADAATVAADQMALHSLDRAEYEVHLKRIGFLADLAHVTNIIFGRFSLQSGKNFLVTSIKEDGERDRIILKVWG